MCIAAKNQKETCTYNPSHILCCLLKCKKICVNAEDSKVKFNHWSSLSPHFLKRLFDPFFLQGQCRHYLELNGLFKSTMPVASATNYNDIPAKTLTFAELYLKKFEKGR